MLVSSKKNILIKILLIFIILVNITNVKSLAIAKPTTDFYVNDYANLLNEDTKNYIINANKSLSSQTGAQVVVVTVPNLEGNSLEEYATQLFRNFGIGDKTKNNGVLLLLALEERQFRVEVGYGLEGILPDGKTGRIQDEYIIPYLKQNNWNEGIKNGFSAIIKVVADEYNIDVGAETAVATEYAKNNSRNLEKYIFEIPIISYVLGAILKTLENKYIIRRRVRVLCSIIYLCIITALYTKVFYIVTEFWSNLFILGIFELINLMGLISFSRSGSRRWLFWRIFFRWRKFIWRRLVRRWRFFWWRRKFKKLLDNKK